MLHAPGMVNQNHYEFSLSTDPYGGIVANGLAAVRWKKLSVVVTYGVNDSPGPLSSSVIPTPLIEGPLTINGQSFQCTGLCTNSYLLAPNYGGSFPEYGEQTGLLTCCINANSAWTQHSGSMALTYAFSSKVSAEIFYSGQASLISSSQPYKYVNFVTAPGYTGAIPAGQYSFLAFSYPNTLPEQLASSMLEEKITAQIGRGLLHVAALQNRVFSFVSASIPGSETFQLFGSGCVASATTSGGCATGFALTNFNGGFYNLTYTSVNGLNWSGSDNRDLLFSYETPLTENLYAGGSYSKSYYDTPCQQIFQFGTFNLPSTMPTAISQTTNEFRFFVGDNPSQKTSIDLSIYFVNANYHIPDPNNTTIDTSTYANATYVDSRYSYTAPRLGFVWRPTATVAVRASAGGGFAEAPLNDLIGSNAPFCFGGTCAVTSPNLNLQPEKSFGFDLGTDIRLPRNTVLSFDVYHTNLYGQLYNETTTSGSCPSCGRRYRLRHAVRELG